MQPILELATRRAIVAPVMAVCVLLVSASVALHGMTWDEFTEFRSLRANARILLQGREAAEANFSPAFAELNQYYGFINKLPALVLWRAAEHAAGDPDAWEQDRLAVAAFHVTSIAFAALALWACFRLASIWPAGHAALAAPLLLLLCPHFVGHAFFNIKDIPFAALYTLLSWQMAAAIGATDALQRRRATVASVVLGGLLAGTKLPGLVCSWPLVAAALFWRRLPDEHRPGTAIRAAWIAAPLMAVVIAVVATPSAWSNPIDWIRGALGLFGSHPWPHCTMTWGSCLNAGATPRDYLLLWFAATTPIVVALPFLYGLGALAHEWRGHAASLPASLPRRVGIAVVLAQLATLPAIAIVTRAALYDGERHVLFVLPAACVVATFGFDRLLVRMRRWQPAPRAAVLGVLALAAAGVAIDCWRLHPYEYVYYNEIARRFDPTTSFETDYWGYSVAELARRHERAHGGETAPPVFVTYPNTAFPFTSRAPQPYEEHVRIVSGGGRRTPLVERPTLVVAIHRLEWRDPPATCRILDEERRTLLFAPAPLVMGRTMICEPLL